MLNFLKNRKFKHGGMSILVTAIFITAVVIINIIATMLVEMFNFKTDLTQGGIFSISQTSLDYLNSLENEVLITVLYDELEFESLVGEYSVQANRVIREYAANSNKIKLQYVDPLTNPGILSDYADDNVNQGNIIVESGERKKILLVDDLYDVSADAYGNYDIKSKAEQAMTSAIIEVTENPATVAILKGNDNGACANIESSLKSNAFTIITPNLTSDKIDEEAAIAILFAPSKDLSADQITKLEEYLYNDGNFSKSLIYVPATNQKSENLPNLTAFLDDWGIVVTNNYVVETDPSKTYAMYGGKYFIFPELNTGSEFSSVISSTDRLFISLYNREITTSFETNQNRKAETLLYSTNTSALYPIDMNESDWDADSVTKMTYSCAVAASRGPSFVTEGVENSYIFAFGSVDFLGDFLLEANALNYNLFINIFKNMSGKSNNTNVVIPPKDKIDILGAALDISDATANILGIIFTFVFPAAVMITGIVIWIRRRHL